MRYKLTSDYSRERAKARLYTTVINVVFFLLLVFGLPEMLRSKPPAAPISIMVELLPVTGISNVPPPPPEKPEPPKQAEKAPAPLPKAPDPKPDVAEPAPLDKTKPAPKPKKEEKKKPEEPKKANDEDFNKLLEKLKTKPEKKKPEAPAPVETPAKTGKSAHYNPALQPSASEVDAIMTQIAKCWSPPPGAKDVANLAPTIIVEYAQDGTFMNATLSDKDRGRYHSDPFFQAMAESAIRAVKKPDCRQLKGLPPEKYESWGTLELYFDPKFLE